LKYCRRFFYEDYRNAPPDQREAAEALTLSALSMFFARMKRFFSTKCGSLRQAGDQSRIFSGFIYLYLLAGSLT
jgi:hypothetical protein